MQCGGQADRRIRNNLPQQAALKVGCRERMRGRQGAKEERISNTVQKVGRRQVRPMIMGRAGMGGWLR